MDANIINEDVYRIIYQDHHDPHQVLGPHYIPGQDNQVVVINCFLPEARTVTVICKSDQREYRMQKLHKTGF